LVVQVTLPKVALMRSEQIMAARKQAADKAETGSPARKAAARKPAKPAAAEPRARSRGSSRPGAASRPYWTGQIRLALVALPVKVFSATKSSGSRPALHQIHGPSGKRIRYQKAVPGIGPVDTDDIVKGYEYEKGSYVLLDDKDLDQIKIESRKVIDLVQFVDAKEIQPIYFEKPYYVVPDGDLAEDGFIVIREALRRTGKVGLGQMALRGGETIVAVKPCGRGLLLETLRYADEVRKSDSLFAEIEDDQPDEELVSLAEELIQRKAGPFDATAFKDNYTEAFRGLIDRKLAAKGGRVTTDDKEPAPSGKIVNLMDALKASVAKKGGGKAPAGGKASGRKAA
jgi:DNA end-binding protein Ku